MPYRMVLLLDNISQLYNAMLISPALPARHARLPAAAVFMPAAAVARRRPPSGLASCRLAGARPAGPAPDDGWRGR